MSLPFLSTPKHTHQPYSSEASDRNPLESPSFSVCGTYNKPSQHSFIHVLNFVQGQITTQRQSPRCAAGTSVCLERATPAKKHSQKGALLFACSPPDTQPGGDKMPLAGRKSLAPRCREAELGWISAPPGQAVCRVLRDYPRMVVLFQGP